MDGAETGTPTHRFVEHVGEVEVELTAQTEAGVFEAGLAAFAELVTTNGAGPPTSRTVELSGRDRCLMLLDWLNELLFLAEIDGFVPTSLTSIELGDETLRARVAGYLGAPRALVKAVALSGLRFEREEGEWHGRAVFDV
jgi:SHS2 domain-containing protein